MTYDDHPDIDDLRKVARGVTTVPPGFDRWRTAPAAASRGFGLRGLALVGACAVFAVSVSLVGLHRGVPVPVPGPAAHSSTPSVAARVAPTAAESPQPTPTPTAEATATPRPTPAVTPMPAEVHTSLKLTYDNNGQSFTVAKGGTISVTLPFAPAHNPPLKDWKGPVAAGNPPQITRTSYSNIPGGLTTAQFTALSPTTTAITIEAWASDPTMSGPPTWSVAITIV